MPTLLKTKQPMWVLENALIVVRDIQAAARPYGYHVALGGGVLNTGKSHNDLDLYCMPMKQFSPNTDKLRTVLMFFLGTEYNLGGGPKSLKGLTRLFVPPDCVYPPEPIWAGGRYTYWSVARQRTDVFIAGE